MDLNGINEWSSEEYAEKESAISAAHRPLLSVLRTAADEYELVDAGASDLANTSFEMSAINQILAWLNFPYQQRPYLDCLIGLAGSSETMEFTATNIEIARQVRTGKSASDDSMSKWVTRQKKKFQLWQSLKQFNLVEIIDGKFNARQRKNTPATYKINIAYWAKIAVAKAKAKDYWRNDPKYRRNQIRAIRRACYEVLQSMPDAPPLRLKIRTLSEEEKLDRRVHLQISSHEKNLDFIHKMNMSEEELHAYVIRELNKAFEKKRGLVGNAITPPDEEPDKKASVFNKLKNGTLLDEISIDEDIETVPNVRYWANGGWIETSNVMPQKDEDSRTDIAADNVHIEAIGDCNLLNPLSHGRTFSDETTDINFSVSTPEQIEDFRTRLEEFLTFPEGFDDG